MYTAFDKQTLISYMKVCKRHRTWWIHMEPQRLISQPSFIMQRGCFWPSRQWWVYLPFLRLVLCKILYILCVFMDECMCCCKCARDIVMLHTLCLICGDSRSQLLRDPPRNTMQRHLFQESALDSAAFSSAFIIWRARWLLSPASSKGTLKKPAHQLTDLAGGKSHVP